MKTRTIDTAILKEYIEVFAGWPQIISVAVLLMIMIVCIMVIVQNRRKHRRIHPTHK